jgi:flavin reductase (DIM6/NTAB) family NADH-FMN oxidoreductase RutF/rubredoxin
MVFLHRKPFKKKPVKNIEALFTISYGLYIVCSGSREQGNGFISNTVFQVTAEPARFAACCSKKNYTSDFISRTGAFSVSVLHRNASPEIFGRFGYKSGKDTDKLEGMQVIYGETGVPIVLNDCIAFLEFRVIQTLDVGTHLLFIGELVHSEVLDNDREPLTYSYYRQVRKGLAPPNAPTYIDKSQIAAKIPVSGAKKYRCTACGHIYDEAIEGKMFSSLPSDWICPACGSGKEDFIEIIN